MTRLKLFALPALVAVLALTLTGCPHHHHDNYPPPPDHHDGDNHDNNPH